MLEMMIALMISSILLLSILKLTTATFNYSIQNMRDYHGVYQELQAILDYETNILNNSPATLNIQAKSIQENDTIITYKSTFGYSGVVIKE